PTDPPTQTPTDPPTQTPTDPPTQTPTDPPTQTPTDPPTQTPTHPGQEPTPTPGHSSNDGTSGNGGMAGPTTRPPRSRPGGTQATPRVQPRRTLRPKTSASRVAGKAHPRRKPWPITMTLKTVPALSGVRFTVDGQPLVTGADGTTTYTVQHDYAGHRLSVISDSVTTANKRYQFYRWAGQRDPNQAFSRTVSGLPMRSNYAVTAAFTVQVPVLPRVVRQDGAALDPTEVEKITARNDNGTIVELPLSSPTWLDQVRPAFHHSVLSAQPVSYSLQSVIVRGANVVDAGRQRFQPAATSNPTFTTQFHDLVITGHDAIFKTKLGTSATITFPDRSKQTVPLNAEHTVTLTNLPRGTYKVTIEAGRGVVGVQQFSLSKDKTADLIVISALDLTILLGLLLIIAVGLLVIGRQYWRRLAHRPRRERNVVLPREKEKILT
ncbi:MAG: hypothetical protein ABIQ09_13470, partial [Jatrophihabitantaceae bacterium]